MSIFSYFIDMYAKRVDGVNTRENDMPGKTKTSKSNEAYFKTYNYDKNKEKRASRHLAKHPNDTQSIERPKAVYNHKRKLSH